MIDWCVEVKVTESALSGKIINDTEAEQNPQNRTPFILKPQLHLNLILPLFTA